MNRLLRLKLATFQQQSQPTPLPYKHKVDYLICDGQQYILTGYTPNYKTGIAIKVGYSSTSSQRLYGSRTSSSSTDAFYISSSSGNFYARIGVNTIANSTTSGTSKPIELYTTEGNEGLYYKHITNYNIVGGFWQNHYYLYKNENLIMNFPDSYYTSGQFTAPTQAALLNAYSGGSLATGTGGFKGRFYYAKISDNRIAIQSFIPVIDYNDVPCLYEEVNGTFHYNEGAGSFGYGSIIS